MKLLNYKPLLKRLNSNKGPAPPEELTPAVAVDVFMMLRNYALVKPLKDRGYGNATIGAVILQTLNN